MKNIFGSWGRCHSLIHKYGPQTLTPWTINNFLFLQPPTAGSKYKITMPIPSGKMVKWPMKGRIRESTSSAVTFGQDFPDHMDLYTGKGLLITDGEGRGQTTMISVYDAASRQAKIEPWRPAVPDKTSKYSIVKMPGLQNLSTNPRCTIISTLHERKKPTWRDAMMLGRRSENPSRSAKNQTPESWKLNLAGRDREVLEIESDLFRREAWAKGKQSELERKRRMTIRAKMWAAVGLALYPGP